MNREIRKLRQSFACAFRGVSSCLRTERNFRIHLTAVCYVSMAALLAELDAVRALILLSGAIAQYGWYRGRCWLRFSSHLWGGGVFYFVTILKER